MEVAFDAGLMTGRGSFAAGEGTVEAALPMLLAFRDPVWTRDGRCMVLCWRSREEGGCEHSVTL